MNSVKYPLGIMIGEPINRVRATYKQNHSEAVDTTTIAANDNTTIVNPTTDSPLACIIDHLDLPAAYYEIAQPNQQTANKLYQQLLARIHKSKTQTKKINLELVHPMEEYVAKFTDALKRLQRHCEQSGKNIDNTMLPIIFDECGIIIALSLRVTLIRDHKQDVKGVLSIFDDRSTTIPSKQILDYYYDNYKGSKQAIKQFIRHIGLEQAFWDKSDTFTQRELDCVINLAEGKTAKETAKDLGISHRTVETHLENIKIKFNTTKKTEMLSVFFRYYRSA